LNVLVHGGKHGFDILGPEVVDLRRHRYTEFEPASSELRPCSS
jgi:hypothetical protein